MHQSRLSKHSENNISIVMDAADRKGNYANFAMLRSNPKETTLDFCFVDKESAGQDGQPAQSGVLVSRIILTNDRLVELRNLIDNHINANFGLKVQNG